ncbi:MAG: hypothetical protein HZC02_01300 [Candidatus Levybacteria bacterium]|nr:hypothetical protein [Candidatus Levybacteria bacterium]
MTSLPITIPDGYKILVKKGDSVKAGDTLAVGDDAVIIPSEASIKKSTDTFINIAQALHISPTSSHKTLLKAPGDMLRVGDVIAQQSKSFGLKKERVISHVNGTIIRFERDAGVLVVKGEGEVLAEDSKQSPMAITSPLDGTIGVCNNNEIVLESESKNIVGSMGFGGVAQGKIVVIAPEEGDEVKGSQITPALKGCILLLPSIDKEAVAKASVIGVGGILGTALTEDLFSYLSSRRINIPVIAIDAALGKTLSKTEKTVAIHGAEKVVVQN